MVAAGAIASVVGAKSERKCDAFGGGRKEDDWLSVASTDRLETDDKLVADRKRAAPFR